MPSFLRSTKTKTAILTIIGLGFVIWILCTSKPFQSCIREGKNHATEQSFQKGIAKITAPIGIYRDCLGDFIHQNGEAITALFTVVLAFSTIGLWLSTRNLWEAGERQIEEFKHATETQSKNMEASIKAANDSAKAAFASNQIAVFTSEQRLRAYVTALDVHMVTHRQPGRISATGQEIPGPIHTYRFAVVLKNGGQTPAVNIVINSNIRSFQTGIPANFDFPDSDTFGHGLIGPQIEWHTPWKSVSASLIEDISLTWAIWGWIEYDDIFTSSGSTSRNRTEFCFRIERKRLPVTNELWAEFIPHDRFNAADWDCLRPIDPITNKSNNG